MVSNFDLNRTALNNQMMGLSTDTKPTTGILPNSLFWELDTNGMYYFDGIQWQSIGGSGGGGGGEGGESDFSTAQVTIYNGTNTSIQGNVPVIANDYAYADIYVEAEEETFNVILYKESAYLNILNPSLFNFELSGNIIEDEEPGYYIISGNCSISVTRKNNA